VIFLFIIVRLGYFCIEIKCYKLVTEFYGRFSLFSIHIICGFQIAKHHFVMYTFTFLGFLLFLLKRITQYSIQGGGTIDNLFVVKSN